MTISDDELDVMEARAAAASAGPWESCVEGRDHESGADLIMTGGMNDAAPDLYVSHSYRDGPPGPVPAPAADLDFIASARQDVPRLLAELRRLRGPSDSS